MEKIMCILFAAAMAFTSGCVNERKQEKKEGSKIKFENIDGEFVPLKDASVTNDFYKISSEMCEEGCTDPITYTGKLYNNIDSKIVINVISDVEMSIEIDGKILNVYQEAFTGADIVDLNIDDEYNELVLFANGPSNDPTASFYRYDGDEIIPIYCGDEESGFKSELIYGYYEADEKDVLPTYGAIWTDQKGRIITSFDNLGFTDERIVFSYFEEDNNSWVQKKLDYTVTDKQYSITQDFDTFFTHQDTEPENYADDKYMCEYNFDNMTKFKKGQKVKLLGYGELYSYYAFYVDVDGKKGVMAFWIGD